MAYRSASCMWRMRKRPLGLLITRLRTSLLLVAPWAGTPPAACNTGEQHPSTSCHARKSTV
jgi:hypothetical protein